MALLAFYPHYSTPSPYSRIETALSQIPQSQLRLADLPSSRATAFDLQPDAQARKAVAAALGLVGIKKLTFRGTLAPQGKTDWALDGALGATVVQECVVTLDPVTTRIDEKLTRAYVADLPEIDAAEVEMTLDDAIDPLPGTLDLAQVMIEALSLALPPYPRTSDAALGAAAFAAPGVTPMTDDDAKPFAQLGALREQLEKK